MKNTIEAYVGKNEWKNMFYSRHFLIVDRLPEGVVRKAYLDPEQPKDAVYDYDFYEVDVTDDDGDTETKYCAVERVEMYGISIKPGDVFSARVYKFWHRPEAEDWLHTEEYDFREREISDDPDYLWKEYETYLPSHDEIEGMDDIAVEWQK